MSVLSSKLAEVWLLTMLCTRRQMPSAQSWLRFGYWRWFARDGKCLHTEKTFLILLLKQTMFGLYLQFLCWSKPHLDYVYNSGQIKPYLDCVYNSCQIKPNLDYSYNFQTRRIQWISVNIIQIWFNLTRFKKNFLCV